MRTSGLVTMLLVGAVALVPAQQRGRTPVRGGTKMVSEVECAASLGTGVKSRRGFCDVIITSKPAESVSMTIPPHTGTSDLQFDLHNRFNVPVTAAPPMLAYARHEAMVTVIRGTGEPIGQAAVRREFRTIADLFDQIGGGSQPGGVKAVAPGPAEAVRFTIPPGVNAVGIVGARLEVLTRATGTQTFETPGRPVAIVSNLRLEYTPAPTR